MIWQLAVAIGTMGQNRRKGVTHTRDEMPPLASRNPNDGRGGQGPFEMADLWVWLGF